MVWQAVVRIRSTQSITKYDAKGKPQPGTGEKKETIEYVVIQKHWTAGKETPWVVWGTTEETTREFFPLGVWRRWGGGEMTNLWAFIVDILETREATSPFG